MQPVAQKRTPVRFLLHQRPQIQHRHLDQLPHFHATRGVHPGPLVSSFQDARRVLAVPMFGVWSSWPLLYSKRKPNKKKKTDLTSEQLPTPPQHACSDILAGTRHCTHSSTSTNARRKPVSQRSPPYLCCWNSKRVPWSTGGLVTNNNRWPHMCCT